MRALLGAGLVLLATPAWGADQKTSSLGWLRLPGAEECVSTQELARAVEARLHRAVFVSPARAELSIEGRVERAGEGFHATIVLRDAAGQQLGTRELARAGACSGLREELAFVVAVMIDPDAALQPEAAAPAPPPAPAPAQQPQPPPPPKPASVAPAPASAPPTVAPAPKAPKTTRFDGGASFELALGLLPHPAYGVAVDGLLQFPHVPPLEGRGAVFPGETVPAPGGEKSFLFGYVAGGLCPLWHEGSRVRGYGCVASYVGAMRAVDTGATRETKTFLFLAPALEGRLTVKLLGPFALRAGVAGLVPLLRPRYETAGVQVHRGAPVAATFDVGLGIVVP